MISRREIISDIALLGGVATAWPTAARAQTSERIFRIGILHAGVREDNDKSTGIPFLSGLAELGYVEKRNLIVETRYAEGRLERLPQLAAEILASRPDLVFAPAAPATAAVKALTTTIPIVFCFVNEPVVLGFARSLARPGGNLTGMSNFSVEIAGKRVELLKELAPTLNRLCAWRNPDAVNDAVELHEVEMAAARFGAQFLVIAARTPAEYDAAAAATRAWGADAIYVNSNPAAVVNRKQIIGLAAALKIPAVYFNTTFVEDGGLICYAANFPDLARRAAAYAGKILRGAKPGDLPVEQPTKFELAINLKTAKALGLTIPQSILLRADEVIE
ncbi:MAG: ABC transporter substrate-binding protein [Proteobacteria bacterium]|nr:ABC transporter substrate-binding protein [Pseudomonadota bacterium]